MNEKFIIFLGVMVVLEFMILVFKYTPYHVNETVASYQISKM